MFDKDNYIKSGIKLSTNVDYVFNSNLPGVVRVTGFSTRSSNYESWLLVESGCIFFAVVQVRFTSTIKFQGYLKISIAKSRPSSERV